MLEEALKKYYRKIGINEKVYDYCQSVEKKLKNRFDNIRSEEHTSELQSRI